MPDHLGATAPMESQSILERIRGWHRRVTLASECIDAARALTPAQRTGCMARISEAKNEVATVEKEMESLLHRFDTLGLS